MNWGKFTSESEFNEWLKKDGEQLMLKELKIFFGTCFERITLPTTIHGSPDHAYYSNNNRFLLISESARMLDKKHMDKDLHYRSITLPNHKVNSKALLWLSIQPPSKEIGKRLENEHNSVLINGMTIDYHFITIAFNPFRLNAHTSFGKRALNLFNEDINVYCNGRIWFSTKQMAEILGLPFSTAYTIANREKLKEGNKISVTSLKGYINRLADEASAKSGVDLRGKFIPIQQKKQNMLYPEQANRILKRSGRQVRISVKPAFYTIKGSSNQGYRFLYRLTDVLNYLNGRHNGY